MSDREKVIKGLEHCGQPTECDGCPYDTGIAGGCFTRLKMDALELLFEQEPRVLTADEVENWVRQKPLNREPIYVEVKDSFCAWMTNDYCGYLPETDLSGELYGKTWRVWSAKPSDAERKAVAWNE